MPVYRASIGFSFDSALPRDWEYINPCFTSSDATALANQLKTNLIANTSVGANTPFVVKIYDAHKAPPSYPVATASQGGTFRASTRPRELALCLSFYAGLNRPRFRGRVFIPGSLIAGGTAARPTTVQQQEALDWSNTFMNNLAPNHMWTVYSKRDGQGYVVSNAWVDDEWDIQRRRGLRGTSRLLKTII